eukprot:14078860-Alexandrium_andersonii.AAC.1
MQDWTNGAGGCICGGWICGGIVGAAEGVESICGPKGATFGVARAGARDTVCPPCWWEGGPGITLGINDAGSDGGS